MKFAMEVGEETEKFTLEYRFNQLLGSLVIKVNDKPVKKKRHLFNEPVREVFDFAVGQWQQIKVRIEKERKLLIGQRNRVFVNDRLVKTFDGV